MNTTKLIEKEEIQIMDQEGKVHDSGPELDTSTMKEWYGYMDDLLGAIGYLEARLETLRERYEFGDRWVLAADYECVENPHCVNTFSNSEAVEEFERWWRTI